MKNQSPEQFARYYCTYKTTHPSGFYYCGKGITEKVEKGLYKGSGVKLKAAWLMKYPFEEWTSTVIHTFPYGESGDTAAYSAEKVLITLEMLADPFCLNTVLGGKGWKYGQFTSKHLEILAARMSKTMKGREFSPQQRAKIADAARKQDHTKQLKSMHKANKGRIRSPEEAQKAWANRRANPKPYPDSAREKISLGQLLATKKQCPHCGKSFRPGPYALHHGEKCKVFHKLLKSDLRKAAS